MKVKFSILFAASVLALGSCSSDDGPTPETAPKIELSRAETVINDGINDFGFDFFTTIANDEEFISKNPNFAVSPVSMAMVMAMCANSLNDDFRDKVCQAMGSAEIGELNAVCNKLMTYLPAKGNKCDMALINSVWHIPSMTPSVDYQNRISDFFQGVVGALDLRSGSAAQEINSWASRHTGGMIKEVVKDEDLLNSFLFLANAMYFKSDWNEPFEKNNTVAGVFYSADGDHTVDFMKDTRQMRYGINDLFDFVTIDYSGPYQFVAIRPAKTTTVAEVAASLTNETLTDALQKSDIYDVELSMPKFESDSKFKCNDIFEAMNLSLAVKGLTGFNPIYSEGFAELMVEVNHFTRIAVDEKGTVAASVSTGNIMDTIAPPSWEKIVFTLDHPFIYLIRNTETGSIIVAGQFTQP